MTDDRHETPDRQATHYSPMSLEDMAAELDELATELDTRAEHARSQGREADFFYDDLSEQVSTVATKMEQASAIIPDKEPEIEEQ